MKEIKHFDRAGFYPYF